VLPFVRAEGGLDYLLLHLTQSCELSGFLQQLLDSCVNIVGINTHVDYIIYLVECPKWTFLSNGKDFTRVDGNATEII